MIKYLDPGMNSEDYIFKHILDQPYVIIITHSPETMTNWKVFVDKTRLLFNSKKFTDAGIVVEAGLEKYPNQARLLTLASDVYRASDNREKSLDYAELLITHHEEKWIGYGRAAQDLIVLKRVEQAQEKIKLGLEKCPNQLNLLTIISDIYHASQDHKKSLEYAELLITHHEEKWIGYGRAAQDLIVLKRVEEAQEKIKLGLEKFPNQVNLLSIASDVYRASNDREKSLECAELLITHQPENWNRYVRAAEDLIALARFKDLEIFCSTIVDNSIKKDLEISFA